MTPCRGCSCINIFTLHLYVQVCAAAQLLDRLGPHCGLTLGTPVANLLLQEDKFAKRSLELLGKANKDGTITTQVTATLRPAPDRNAGVQLYDLVRADTPTSTAVCWVSAAILLPEAGT